TLPDTRSSARHVSASEGLGPRLVCGATGGSATSGGDRTPRIRPRTLASGWMKCRYATAARYQTLLPLSESTSERVAYAMFFPTVPARPTPPLNSSNAAAQACTRVAATPMPRIVRMDEITCQWIECGRNANGCTSVRYTDGNAAVPHTPALTRVPQSD